MDMRNDLAAWIQRRSQKGIGKKDGDACAALVECGVPVEELRQQWQHQQQCQTSLHSRECSRLNM